jgi:hypothetical protein
LPWSYLLNASHPHARCWRLSATWIRAERGGGRGMTCNRPSWGKGSPNARPTSPGLIELSARTRKRSSGTWKARRTSIVSASRNEETHLRRPALGFWNPLSPGWAALNAHVHARRVRRRSANTMIGAGALTGQTARPPGSHLRLSGAITPSSPPRRFDQPNVWGPDSYSPSHVAGTAATGCFASP